MAIVILAQKFKQKKTVAVAPIDIADKNISGGSNGQTPKALADGQVVYYSTIKEVNMMDLSKINDAHSLNLPPRREYDYSFHGQTSGGSASVNIPSLQHSYQSSPRQTPTSSSIMTSALQPHIKHKRRHRAF